MESTQQRKQLKREAFAVSIAEISSVRITQPPKNYGSDYRPTDGLGASSGSVSSVSGSIQRRIPSEGSDDFEYFRRDDNKRGILGSPVAVC